MVGAGEMAQVAKCLQRKLKDLSMIPGNYVKKLGMVACLQSQRRGSRDKQIPGAGWLSNPKHVYCACMLACVYACVCGGVGVCARACLHTHSSRINSLQSYVAK